MFWRLRALEGVLGNALKHAAGVHPDKHRLASLHSRNILDGALLFRYCRCRGRCNGTWLCGGDEAGDCFTALRSVGRAVGVALGK